jgi:hypothetical protein
MFMHKVLIGAAILSATLLAGCGGGKGGILAGRNAPDEFAVSRRAPLTIPPDFALVPPKPGAPRPQEADSSTQALNAMFGGAAPRSAAETSVVSQAGTVSEPGIRSDVADPNTVVVNKGSATQDILTAPESQSPEATATTPQ